MTSSSARLTAALADRYRTVRELGAGGMATVYLARDLKHDRDVAIKVLHPELAAALGGDRFLSEIKTTAKLQHPHILPLLDSGEADGLLYYVMPYVTGETLRARLERERQLPIDDALRIAREVADALGSAHALGIIHRDIKPENILLQGGHALVADFGIALAVQSAGGARMTQTGLSLGTPQYMSPEQAMGERIIDARADIYALGAVTYEMLTGDPPFTGSSVQAIIAKVMTEKPTAPSAVRDTVTPAVEHAVLRSLSKLPADRFANAAEFTLALDAMGVTSARGPATSRAPRRASIAASLAALALCMAGAWWLGRRTVAPTAAADSISSSVLLPDSTPLDPTRQVSEGLATLALSPDGSALVFVGRKGSSTQLFIRRRSSFDIRPIEGTEGAYSPFFSPNGDAVAFFAGSELKRVSLADQRVSVIREAVSDAWGGAWAPDGRIVVSRIRATELLVLSASGDSLKGIHCRGACSYPELLPDGRRAIVSGPAGRIGIVGLDTGSVHSIPRFGGASAADAVRGAMARLDGDGHLVWVAQNGTIVAAPFDASRAAVTGPPVAVAEGVRVESGRGAAQFALSRSGTIAFAPGPLMSLGILVLADRGGRLDTIPAPPANYDALDLSPDGRRVLARVAAPNGESLLNVIDVANGQVIPWLATADRIGSTRWDVDGRRAYVVRGRNVLLGDPTLSTAPETVLVNSGRGFQPLPGGKLYLEDIGDTTVLMHFDRSGTPVRVVTSQASGGGVTRDIRWLVQEEVIGGASAIVARALDGSGRRFIVPASERFSMVSGASGTNELIMGEAPRGASSGVAGGAEVQAFWSLPYDPTAAEPFGTPKRLFAARVADFPGRNYAVDRTAQRFVFKQHVTAASPREIRLVDHWHAALTARATSTLSGR